MLPVLETAAHSPLTIVWFILITVLWVGFFFLEGFDFGVAMLLPFMGRDDKDRRLMVNTIGPTWDGNEVWLLTAGGATFAAFPGWYATMFSGLYLPLLLVLLGLIIRGVSFEYRSKHPSSKWRNTFDWMATIGSFLPTLVLGVGFANFVRGLAVGPHPTPDGGVAPLVTTSFWGLFTRSPSSAASCSWCFSAPTGPTSSPSRRWVTCMTGLAKLRPSWVGSRPPLLWCGP